MRNLLVSSFLVSTLVLSLAGCKKDDSSGDPQKGNRIKTYTETINSSTFGNHTVTFNMAYDQDGRLSTMTDASEPGNRFVFAYRPAGFAFDIYSGTNIVIHEDVFLNGVLIDSTLQYNDEGDTTAEKYFYNADKLLVSMNTYTHSQWGSALDEVTHYTYDASKNLIQETDGFTTITYAYDGVVLNVLDLFPVYHSPSKQLPSKETYLSGGEQVTIDHTYSFDSQNRLISDQAVASSGDVVIKSFTYE